MSLRNILLVIFISASFVCWPIVGKYSQTSGAWTALIATVATLIVITALSFSDLFGINSIFPDKRAVALLFIAGALNGLGVHFYAGKSVDPTVITSTFVVTVALLMVVWAPIFDWLFNNTIFNFKQILGFIFAAIAIYFLSN